MFKFPKRAPCPLCGAEINSYQENREKKGPKLLDYENDLGNCLGYSIACTACDYEGPFGKTSDEAINRWDEQALYIHGRFSVGIKHLQAVKFEPIKQVPLEAAA
jgi:hypothetical protein